MSKNEIKFDRHNYRTHSDKNKSMIRKSLADCGAGRSVLVDANNELIAGNGVYEQAQALGIPTRIIETDGSELVVVKRTDLQTDDRKRKELALADNAASDKVEWNMEEIKCDFADIQLEDWGIEVPEIETDDVSDLNIQEKEKNETAERLLNEAMQSYCGEMVKRVDICMQHGFLPTTKTESYARMQFIKAKYYGYKYERNISLIFTPRQFFTSASKLSYYDQLKKTAKDGKVGIAGFRTLSNNGDLAILFSTNYHVGVGRMPLDFPVDIARRLICKYSNKGRVLDPCHGWGGRLVACMLEDVREYVGCDPSDVAHDGVTKIYNTYKQYQDTKATLLKTPYEDAQIEGMFDFAFTSPPYFDVEQYDGNEQSHVKYNNYKLWVEKFYTPLIVNTMNRLNDGCVFALQVGSQSYPLKDDAIRICNDNGFSARVEDTNIYKTNIHDTSDEKGECIIIISK